MVVGTSVTQKESEHVFFDTRCSSILSAALSKAVEAARFPAASAMCGEIGESRRIDNSGDGVGGDGDCDDDDDEDDDDDDSIYIHTYIYIYIYLFIALVLIGWSSFLLIMEFFDMFNIATILQV